MAVAVLVFVPFSPDWFWRFALTRYGIGWTARREWLVDVGANVALFAPAGALLAECFRRAAHARPWRDALIAAAMAAAAIELTQRVRGGRVPSVQDAVCNTVGAVLGIALVRFLTTMHAPAPPVETDRDS